MADFVDALNTAAESNRRAIEAAAAQADAVGAAVDLIVGAIAAKALVLFAGNGGSAADAQHLAAELVGRFAEERDAWGAVALNTNTSVLTAVGNDYGFDRIFARQVEALGQPDGVFVGISTSGTSPNVVEAATVARARGMRVIALVGPTAGPLADLADVVLSVPDARTPHVQEAHIFLGHVICGLVEERLCAKR